VATVRKHFNDGLRLAGVVVNRYRADRRDRVDWAEQLRADYGEHLVEPFIPEREVVAIAATDAAPLSAYGARGRDVTAALTALAARVVPAPVA
jgi:chromosome partitioning protein